MNALTYILAAAFATVATEAATMMLVFLAPFVVFAVLIHFCEQLIQRRLAERFGWNSVLVTGWLGTPIHELSHAMMCWLFRHRVDEIALFEPDPVSGRLGYVRHSYRRGNWFEEIGNLFIGIAPLIGGAIVLALLLWLFYPQAAAQGIAAARTVQEAGGILSQTWLVASHIGGEILTPTHWVTTRFWVFLYLVLCVGTHMAPSGSDYQGATRGALLALLLMAATTFLAAASGVELHRLLQVFVHAAGPLYAILGLAVLLCGLTTGLVYLLTMLIPQSYSVR